MKPSEYAAYPLHDRLVFASRASSASDDVCELLDEAASRIAQLHHLLLEIQEASSRPGVVNQEWLYRFVTDAINSYK